MARVERRATASMIALLLVVVASLAMAGAANAAHHEKEPSAKDAIPIEKRQEIFRAMSQARTRADRDAEKASMANPQSEAQSELATKLTKEYEAKVIEKFGITKRQAEQVIEEGYAKAWKTGGSGMKDIKTSLP
jgi:hypothetical protein